MPVSISPVDDERCTCDQTGIDTEHCPVHDTLLGIPDGGAVSAPTREPADRPLDPPDRPT